MKTCVMKNVESSHKSDTIFYSVPGHSNEKTTHRIYIDSILDPIVKPWLERGDDFVLEEDGDSGHGTGKTRNIVKKNEKKSRIGAFY